MSDKYIEIELVDANGEKYRVGYPESAWYFESTIHSELKTLKQEVGNPPAVLDWAPDVRPTVTPDAAKEIGIVEGFVESGDGIIFDNRLHFRNTKGWYFTFKDEVGRYYTCSTPRNGWHYIDYTSSKPTIVSVA